MSVTHMQVWGVCFCRESWGFCFVRVHMVEYSLCIFDFVQSSYRMITLNRVSRDWQVLTAPVRPAVPCRPSKESKKEKKID